MFKRHPRLVDGARNNMNSELGNDRSCNLQLTKIPGSPAGQGLDSNRKLSNLGSSQVTRREDRSLFLICSFYPFLVVGLLWEKWQPLLV